MRIAGRVGVLEDQGRGRHLGRLAGVRGVGSHGKHSWGHRVRGVWGRWAGLKAVGLAKGHHLCQGTGRMGAGWREERVQAAYRGPPTALPSLTPESSRLCLPRSCPTGHTWPPCAFPGQNAAPPLPGVQAWWPEATEGLGSKEGDTGGVPLRRAFSKGKPEEG